MLTVWFTIVAVLGGGPVSAANYRQVGLFLHPSRYLVPQYTTSANPGAEYVFVAGEPILLGVEFSNVELAEARKQRDVAAREYEMAVEILRRGEDTLYIQARPADVEDRMRGLQSMREALKAKSRN